MCCGGVFIAFPKQCDAVFLVEYFSITRTKMPVAISIVAHHDVHECLLSYGKINRFVFGKRTANANRKKRMITQCCEQFSRHICQQTKA